MSNSSTRGAVSHWPVQSTRFYWRIGLDGGIGPHAVRFATAACGVVARSTATPDGAGLSEHLPVAAGGRGG